MRFCAFVFVFLAVAPGVAAYQASTPNRTNFATGQQPATPKNDNYRAFSNYNNRSWGQGVQTQAVQTEVAGRSAVDFDKNTPQKLISKTQSATPAASATPAKPAATSKPAASTQPPAQATAAANVDPAAMMQQMQGMMNAMSSMTGGNAANGQAAAGMPDISALMGNTAAPTAAPAKK